MSTRCVDAALYWTPAEAAAIIDYLDRLRDTVWELYGDDIIAMRLLEEQPIPDNQDQWEIDFDPID